MKNNEKKIVRHSQSLRHPIAFGTKGLMGLVIGIMYLFKELPKWASITGDVLLIAIIVLSTIGERFLWEVNDETADSNSDRAGFLALHNSILVFVLAECAFIIIKPAISPISVISFAVSFSCFVYLAYFLYLERRMKKVANEPFDDLPPTKEELNEGAK